MHRYLNSVASSLSETTADDIGLLLEPLNSLFQFGVQVLKVKTNQIAQLNAFQIAPDALIGIQFWSIAGQLFQPDTLRRPGAEKVLDCTAAVRGNAIPDHQELARNVIQQVLQKTHYIWPLEGMILDHQVKLACRGNRADRREVIPGQPLTQDGRLAYRGISAYHGGQGPKARFIHEQDGTPLRYGFF